MKKKQYQPELDEYHTSLILAEMSANTIRKYLADIEAFSCFAGCPAEQANKEAVIAYKEWLKQSYRPNSVNSKLLSLNRYFSWIDRADLKVKTKRVEYHRCLEKVVSEQEYHRLLTAAYGVNRNKIFLIIKTLASTGIRVGELCFVTYEAVLRGSNTVDSKGRQRLIFLPQELCKMLLIYCQSVGITSGPVFLGYKENPISHSCIWRTLKRLAAKAQVDPDKVYPHSFRHLFAKTYLQRYGNIAELADILGHASIETTRIYLVTSVSEKRDKMNALNL